MGGSWVVSWWVVVSGSWVVGGGWVVRRQDGGDPCGRDGARPSRVANPNVASFQLGQGGSAGRGASGGRLLLDR